MRKLLVIAGLGGLAWWLVKDRLGGEPDEFVFTEAPPPEDAGEDPAPPEPSPPPPAS